MSERNPQPSNTQVEDYSAVEKKYEEDNGKVLDTKTLEEVLKKYLGEKEEKKKDFKDEVMERLSIVINIDK